MSKHKKFFEAYHECLPKCGHYHPTGWWLGWNKSWESKEAAAGASSLLLEQVLDHCCHCPRTLGASPFTHPKQTLPSDSPESFQAFGPGLGWHQYPSCSEAPTSRWPLWDHPASGRVS